MNTRVTYMLSLNARASDTIQINTRVTYMLSLNARVADTIHNLLIGNEGATLMRTLQGQIKLLHTQQTYFNLI